MLNVYLAGGFYATVSVPSAETKMRWQQWAKLQMSSFANVFDPGANTHVVSVPQYSTLDYAAVKRCDVMLAYMDADNPGGYALASEIGYAHALNKLIVLVDEKSEKDPKFERYFAMTRHPCLVIPTLQEAVGYLNAYAQMYHRAGILPEAASVTVKAF